MEKACDSKGSPNFSNPLPDERGFPQTSDALPERWVTLHSGDMGDTFSRRREKVFMSWKECQIVEERLRFIARLLDGEKMAGLCREFGISRKTGYKIYNFYQVCGINSVAGSLVLAGRLRERKLTFGRDRDRGGRLRAFGR